MGETQRNELPGKVLSVVLSLQGVFGIKGHSETHAEFLQPFGASAGGGPPGKGGRERGARGAGREGIWRQAVRLAHGR